MKSRTKKRTLVLGLAGALVALALATTALAEIVTERDGGANLAVTFEARAAAAPKQTSCRALPGVQKLEGRYGGTMTINGEEKALNFSLEILLDRSTGVGTAQGSWQLTEPPDPDLVARGELLAVVTTVLTTPPEPDTTPPDPEAEPPEPDLELHGLLLGSADPPDPDLPAQRLLLNFAGAITDGSFHFAGAGGDPTGRSANPGALMPAVKC